MRGIGRDVTLSSQLGSVGEHLKLLQWVRGRYPANHVLEYSELERVYLQRRDFMSAARDCGNTPIQRKHSAESG